jgi:MoaA/NifB/PqqE/SkfB family radical SAM enzyme
MSLIYRRKANQPSISHVIYDYLGEIRPFVKRIDRKYLIIPLVILKSIEWSIYRWYKTPIRRFYGVKGNELIYMITKRCNERCSKCGIWKNPEPDTEHLAISKFINCLKSLHHNLYQVTLTGGEPLLFMDDVMVIAEESKKLDVPMMTVTNGSLLTEEFLKRYSQLGHRLVISIDTLDSSKWEYFRGRDNYDQVLQKVHLAHSILGKRLGVQSVLAKETTGDIPKIKVLCDELGIEHSIQPYMDFGGYWSEHENYSKNENGVACAARKNICIYPNGDVVKCFDHHRIPIAKEPLGNINKEEIIPILCKKRSTEISKVMKTCDYPCKQMSCNIPSPILN